MKELRSARMYCHEYASGRSTIEEEIKGSNDGNVNSKNATATTFLHLYSVLTYDTKRQERILQFSPFVLKDLYKEQLVLYAEYCIQLLKIKGKEAFLRQTSTTPSGEPHFFCDELKNTFEYIMKINEDRIKYDDNDDNNKKKAISLPSHHHLFGYDGNESIQYYYNHEENQWCRALHTVSC